ncbi:MAG: MurR/RpiR family transcriptional regulator [Clostridia bacterium]|nr:MurR/RpiR family transcriptional regulator [Clostridia bacterium]
MTARENPTTLVMRIENAIPNLSKSEKVVAGYIVQNPEQVISLSVAALADICGVSDPTVVRMCQKLGFSGYQSLKLAMAAAVVPPSQTVHEAVTPSDDIKTVVEKVFQSALFALQLTRDTLDVKAMGDAAEALLAAKRIVILGQGASGPIAADLHHKLLRLGMNAMVYTDSHLQAIACSYLERGDVVFTISHSGSSKAVVDNAAIAKKSGAEIIALTSSGKSPLSKIADIYLTTTSSETKYRVVAISSRAAALTIVDSLYTYLAMRCKDAMSLKVEKNMEHLKY